MAPEQITNFRDVGPAADQYSAAATLYYLLTRKYPYDLPKDSAKRLLKVLQEPPFPIQNRSAEISQSLAFVIHKALERSPVDRFADVNEFRAALEECTRE
jgi:serine/threonine-protein kinase